MKEYIERAAAIEAIRKYQYPYGVEFLLSNIPAADVVEVRHAKWKYFHKQNKAVCTNCSFECDLDADFGRAIACPNCGARMNKEDEHEAD